MELLKKVLFLLLFISSTQAAIKVVRNSQVNLNKLKLQVDQVKKNLDKKILYYENSIDLIDQIEKKLLTREKVLQIKEKELIHSYKEIKRTIYQVVINNESTNDDVKELLKKKAKLLALNSQVRKFREEYKTINSYKRRIVDLKKTLKENYEFKETIKSKIKSLFAEKFSLENKFKTFKKTKRVSKAKKIYIRNLLRPVNKYKKATINKKNITFDISEQDKLMAVDHGKVAYIGKLSTFGKLLIIKHKNNIQSIYLGHFSSLYKMGDKVKKGKVVAITTLKKNSGSYKSDKSRSFNKKLYFELRHNNFVLNTKLWINKMKLPKIRI